DGSGIRNRLLIVSACFSGGFIPDLATPDTLVITAARHDRPSFGCGDSGSATYFGQALLVEGLNRDGGLVDAFDHARRQVGRREMREGHEPSFPQINVGDRIRARLDAWEAELMRGPPLAYPLPLKQSQFAQAPRIPSSSRVRGPDRRTPARRADAVVPRGSTHALTVARAT